MISGVMLIQKPHLQSQHGSSRVVLHLPLPNTNMHFLRLTAASTIRGEVTKMENMTTISIITMVDMEKEAEETIATLSYLSMGAITIRGTTLTTITVVMVVGTDRSIAAMGRQHIILMGKEWVRPFLPFYYFHITHFSSRWFARWTIRG